MKRQFGSNRSAAALLALFVVVAYASLPSAKAAAPQSPAQATHEAEEQIQRASDHTAHEAAEDAERAAQAAHEAEEELQRASEHAAHEAAEDAERAAQAAHEAEEELQRASAHAAHEAAEDAERAAKAEAEALEQAADAVHEAEEERQRAIAKAAHEAEEDLQRAARAEEKSFEHQAAMDITVIGCVIREREYRKVHHSGKGGAFGFGIGGGNEYILVGAIRLPSRLPLPAAGQPCDPTIGGDAYELTGKGESSLLRPYLGHWVELTGLLKRAEITKETRGTANPRPTGGKGPFWQDLKIFEINVYAAKDYVPPVVAVIPPPIEERAEAVPPPAPEPQPEATAGREELPKTASEMPLVGLLGFFFFSAAIALRFAHDRSDRARR